MRFAAPCWATIWPAGSARWWPCQQEYGWRLAPTGDWSLTGATLAPPYDADGFELGDADELTEVYPKAAADIARFTRRAS